MGDVREDWKEALDGKHREAYWRGLDELLKSPDFRERARREFPPGVDESLVQLDGFSRRTFLKLLGASMALAGVAGCAQAPRDDILPYVKQPPELRPGDALHYATTMTLAGYGTGLLVEGHAGRPTKVEGNPEHPASLGAAGVFEQASVLQLYNPRRARGIRRDTDPALWSDFARALSTGGGPGAGTGLHFLLEPTASPLHAALIGRIRARLPGARFHFYAPLSPNHAWEGARAAVGQPLQPVYAFDRAAVVLSLDADFMASGPYHLRYARDFADGRRIAGPDATMNRLYQAESMLTPTGTMADHRLRLRTGEVPALAAAVLAALGGAGAGVPATLGAALQRFRAAPRAAEWVRACAHDLAAARGRGLVVAGERQPPVVHALAHAMNAALGSIGGTVRYVPSPLVNAGQASHGLEALVGELRAGQVDTLVVLEGNPAYAAPADLEVGQALGRARRVAYVGLFENETAAHAHWFIPARHYLETWGDARAYDGTASIVQPLIRPMYGGRSVAEVLAFFAGEPEATDYALVRGLWRQGRGGSASDAYWDEALQHGILPEQGSGGGGAAAGVSGGPGQAAAAPSPAGQGSVAWDAIGRALQGVASEPPRKGAVEVTLRGDPGVYDGRFADNAWLQELPDPMTKVTWDNAAVLGPKTADAFGVATDDVVELDAGGRKLRLPVFVLPGHADNAVTVSLGYGRDGAEQLAGGIGGNAYALMTTRAPFAVPDVRLTPVLEEHGAHAKHVLATTQTHWAMHGRPIVLGATLGEYRAKPDFTKEHRGPVAELYDSFAYKSGDQWAMNVDLSLCSGCNACVVACQAENNIPVVGRVGVHNRREMYWLRIDRYFSGGAEDPDVVMQPMLCQHCETAPCEYVCPVNATVHSSDGLNENDLQPLRRHPLLQQQLPLQGAPLQLVRLQPEQARVREAGGEPGRDRARARRHGEVHLLRAADPARADPGAGGEPRARGGRGVDGVPAGVSHARADLRLAHEPGGGCGEAAARPPPLRGAARPGHAAAHDVPGAHREPEPRAEEDLGRPLRGAARGRAEHARGVLA